MQIWLGKQHLDQRDKIEQTNFNEPLPLIIEGESTTLNGKSNGKVNGKEKG